MPINEYATVDSFYALNKWIGILNDQAKNSPMPGYKATRVDFNGGPVVQRTLPAGLLQQQAEGSLNETNYIDFSQGDISGTDQSSHLAIRGDGFFVLCPPGDINQNTGAYTGATSGKLLVTRDGEFKPDANGMLVQQRTGYYLVATDYNGAGWSAAGIRAIYDNSDGRPNASLTRAMDLSDYMSQTSIATTKAADGVTNLGIVEKSLFRFPGNDQYLTPTIEDPSVFDFGHKPGVLFHNPKITTMTTSTNLNNTVGNFSLEQTNAPLTQTTPELAEAQRMYDNLTKILTARKSNFDLLTSLFH